MKSIVEKEVGQLLETKKLSLSTAESCTGGSLSARITSVAGSSSYFKGGVIAYSNEVKVNLLHVLPVTIQEYGAVSKETVVEMVKGAMASLKTDCAIATSGIAGPDGGTLQKPVGTIWIAAGVGEEIVTMKLSGDRGRSENIEVAVCEALILLKNLLK